jgi:hypothetical protein
MARPMPRLLPVTSATFPVVVSVVMLRPLGFGCRLDRRRAEPLLAVEKRSTLQQVAGVVCFATL